ncbi:MAG: rubredoxin [Coriobacteriales bacterium]|jgi:rubredoxin|nr:rubredoxin [Coriobacteriales bacterium]
MRYECGVCGFIYDPALGDIDSDIEPDTAFADLPQDWICPGCGAAKNSFEPTED